MIPDSVSFSGLELNPRDLLIRRKKAAPYPSDWSRIVLDTELSQTVTMSIGAQRKLDEWLISHIPGRFGVVISYPKVILYFEHHADAIVCRLMEDELPQIVAIKE